MSEPVQPVYEPSVAPEGKVTLIPNREIELFTSLHERIQTRLELRQLNEVYRQPLDYTIPDMTVQQMFGIDPGSFVFIAKVMGESTQPWNKGMVERARTVEIITKLIDARYPKDAVLIKLHCYEHVYNGVHDIELVVQKHKYFEWIIDEPNQEQEDEIVSLSHRYLCTGLIGDLPIKCKYPPPHIPQVR